MSLTILDVIVIVVVLISAILAMVRGFVREVLSIASWVAAAGAAYVLYKPLIPLVAAYVDSSTARSVIAAAVVFFVALIVATYVTTKIADFVIDSRVGAVDRAFGFMFGAARGILLLVVALLFFDWLVQPSPTWVAQAQSRAMLEDLGQKLVAAMPEDVEASIVKRIRGDAGDETGSTPDDAAPDATTVPDTPDYGNATRNNLDQLIENRGGAAN